MASRSPFAPRTEHRDRVRELAEEIDRIRARIRDREQREQEIQLFRGPDSPYHDPGLDRLYGTLVRAQFDLLGALDRVEAGEGPAQEGLDSGDQERTPAQRAAIMIVKKLALARALPAENPVVDEEEVEEEFRRKLGGRGGCSNRRRPVRSR